jgi:hypothetical protein
MGRQSECKGYQRTRSSDLSFTSERLRAAGDLESTATTGGRAGVLDALLSAGGGVASDAGAGGVHERESAADGAGGASLGGDLAVHALAEGVCDEEIISM